MPALTFTPADRQDSGTGTTKWSSNATCYTHKYQIIRIVWNNSHFNNIPSNAKINSVVISFTAKNNTTTSSQAVDIYLQNSDLSPANSLNSADRLCAFDNSFSNSSISNQTVTKTLTSGSAELEKFITWMKKNPLYMTLHATTRNSPSMQYVSFSVTINYLTTVPYIHNGTKWVEVSKTYIHNGTKWVESTPYIHDGIKYV